MFGAILLARWPPP